jgi:hypothetical protein
LRPVLRGRAAISHAIANAVIHAGWIGHTDADTDRHGHRDANADTYCHGHRDANPNADRHSNRYSFGYPDHHAQFVAQPEQRTGRDDRPSHRYRFPARRDRQSLLHVNANQPDRKCNHG